MGQITVSVGSFDKHSVNGVTVYGTTANFTIPANAGITGCSVAFATHNSGGTIQDRAFALNGARAHSSGSWAKAGTLDHTLLSTGGNTFRVSMKSRVGAVCWWHIASITLTINYNDVSSGGGGETREPGVISLNKTSLTAGEGLTVSVTGASGGVYRDVYIQKMPSTANILSVAQGHGSGVGSWAVTIPESWCATLSPDDPSFEVRIYMVSYIAGGAVVGDGAKMLTVNVPESAVPTIGAFTATRNNNGVDASITNYVQNYSKVSLAMGSVAGALGSSIQSYEITGAGFSAATSSAAFGPFAQTGDITFTAKVTDTRGRTATKSVSINVLPYTPVSGVNLLAYRSDGSMVADDEGAYATLRGRRVFSSLDGQNAGTIRGRVYEKDTTPGGWTTMSDDTLLLLGGSMSIEKGYTTEISINDKITTVVYVFQIPTAIVGIHIMPGATGGGFGMYGQADGWYFSKKLVAPGLAPNPNILHNWDFTNPVNQRGVSDTISTGTYFYDRWIRNSGTVTTNADYLTIGASAEIEQRIEGNMLAGETVTVTVKVGTSYISGSSVFPTSAGTASITLTGWGTATLGYATGYMYVRLSPTAASNVVRVKLEMGTVSTLAYDVPMDFSKELLVCQHFAKKIERASKVNLATTSLAVLQFLFPTMRIAPTITLPSNTNFLTASNVGSWTPAERIITDVTTSSAAIVCSGTFTGIHYGAVNNGAIFLSADL